MRVFSALQDATADALYMMVNEHPEAFARLRAADADAGGSGRGKEKKVPRTERATSVIREIMAPPVFEQRIPPIVVVPTLRNSGIQGDGGAPARSVGDQFDYPYPGNNQQHYGNDGTQYRGFHNDGTNREDTIDHDFDLDLNFNHNIDPNIDPNLKSSFFTIKPEDPELPPRSRLADPAPSFNDRGEMLLADAPEPTFVFCGRYRISSFGLKMEARRADGAAVKISVHLKNLRKPVRS